MGSRGERAIRQLGFQESDIVTMAQPITKAASANTYAGGSSSDAQESL